MKKAKKAVPPSAPAEKGFFALAGEAFAVLGEEIVEGKDKIVEAAAVRITAVKKAIKKITHKKKALVKKKAPVKKAPAVKKAAAGPVKKSPPAKAAPPKKAVRKAAPPKSIKKSATVKKKK